MRSYAELFNDLFCRMPEKLRREMYILGAMKMRGTNYSKLAEKHGLSAWYLNACAKGTFPLLREPRRIFERELGIDLEPFLLEGEEY